MEVTPLNAAFQVPAPAAASVSPAQKAQNRQLIEAVYAVNAAALLGEDNKVTFVMDPGSQRPVIQIVNRQTNELIRQIPPEGVLTMAAALRPNG